MIAEGGVGAVAEIYGFYAWNFGHPILSCAVHLAAAEGNKRNGSFRIPAKAYQTWKRYAVKGYR